MQEVIGPKGANLKAAKDASGVKLIDVHRKESYTTGKKTRENPTGADLSPHLC